MNPIQVFLYCWNPFVLSMLSLIQDHYAFFLSFVSYRNNIQRLQFGSKRIYFVLDITQVETCVRQRSIKLQARIQIKLGLLQCCKMLKHVHTNFSSSEAKTKKYFKVNVLLKEDQMIVENSHVHLRSYLIKIL